MILEPAKLQAHIAEFVKGRLPDGVKTITVEPSVSHEGTDFLLVTIELISADADADELGKILEGVEDEVAKWDERYPSVRFQEAA